MSVRGKMSVFPVRDNISRILKELPPGAELEAACKTRSANEIQQAVDAGVRILGENYVSEALKVHPLVRGPVRWHFIGHLQRNKVKKALKVFDMIETLDSWALAETLSEKSAGNGKAVECLVEINSAREKNKYGLYPEEAEGFVAEAAKLKNLRIRGLMTMGPFTEDPEEARPYFSLTRRIYESMRDKIPGCRMEILSMGMSSTYRVALTEGANIVRVGTALFGPR